MAIRQLLKILEYHMPGKTKLIIKITWICKQVCVKAHAKKEGKPQIGKEGCWSCSYLACPLLFAESERGNINITTCESVVLCVKNENEGRKGCGLVTLLFQRIQELERREKRVSLPDPTTPSINSYYIRSSEK